MPMIFLYGPDLARERVFDRIGSCDVLGVATLEGYRVEFNKPNLKDKAEGFANLVAAEGETTIGVVYDPSRKQLELLGGYFGGYSQVDVKPHLKKAGKKVDAETFIARRTGRDLGIRRASLDLMIQGAEENGLPRDFVEGLRGLKVIDDG